MQSQKDLIPFICVVFSNVVLSWKNALALPVQNSGSKGFFSVKWNCVKSVRLKILTFCSCKSTLVFVCFPRCCVSAKLRLKVFIFCSTINHQKSSIQHTPFQKCGGVLHHDCSTRLGWLMFARCAVQVGHWKNHTPSNGHSGYHGRKWRDFYCSQQQLYDGKISWNQRWDCDTSLTALSALFTLVFLLFCFPVSNCSLIFV